MIGIKHDGTQEIISTTTVDLEDEFIHEGTQTGRISTEDLDNYDFYTPEDSPSKSHMIQDNPPWLMKRDAWIASTGTKYKISEMRDSYLISSLKFLIKYLRTAIFKAPKHRYAVGKKQWDLEQEALKRGIIKFIHDEHLKIDDRILRHESTKYMTLIIT